MLVSVPRNAAYLFPSADEVMLVHSLMPLPLRRTQFKPEHADTSMLHALHMVSSSLRIRKLSELRCVFKAGVHAESACMHQ